MNLKYKFGNKEEPGQDNPDIENYKTDGQARNVCFVQPDGKRVFLNYAYLVAGEFNPEDGSITLAFTTHRVELQGRNLEELFDGLMAHQVRQIRAMDKRYEGTRDEKESFIIIINITSL